MKTIRLFSYAFFIAAGCTDIEPRLNAEVPAPPPSILYQVVSVLPHDTSSFTEGLVFHNGTLIESTGMPGTSWMGPVDPLTGKIERKINLPQEFFGEGITVLHDKIYHLTWTSHKGFIYDANSFTKTAEFSYPMEGWGITNDGTHLVTSDGSNKLYYLQPDSMQLVKTIKVTDNVGPVSNLNELEFIDGYIYANQWQTTYILKIDTADGKVVGRADFRALLNEVEGKIPGIDFADNVLNGIAYDNVSKKIYVTGKRWPSMFEIKFF